MLVASVIKYVDLVYTPLYQPIGPGLAVVITFLIIHFSLFRVNYSATALFLLAASLFLGAR